MIKSRINSLKYALKGIYLFLSLEVNARIHIVAAIIVVSLAWYLSVSSTEWALLIIAIFGVMSAEAFNTSIEQLTNLVSPEYHPLAEKTKDLAAGAVLLITFAAIGIGLIVFGKYLL